MFWIHGGGYTTGDATDMIYGPGKLLDRDIILVTVQYRLGPLGSMTLGNDQVAGNQAVWDQREGRYHAVLRECASGFSVFCYGIQNLNLKKHICKMKTTE